MLRENMRFLLWQWVLAFLIWPSSANAQLATVPTFCSAYPSQCNLGSMSLLAARGIGTNAYYVLEVDETTGEIPVTLSGAGITIDYSGTPGDPVPGSAAYIGGIDGTGDLQGIIVDTDGHLQVDILSTPYDLNYGTPGAATLRTAAMLGVGAAAVSNANPVPISDAGGVITVDGTVGATQSGAWDITNISGTVSLPTGAATSAKQDTAQTTLDAIKVDTEAIETAVEGTLTVAGTVAVSSTASPTGRSYGDSGRIDFSSTNVTTGAWVELDASTAATINALLIDSTCGEVLELGTGAAAAETRVLVIPRGGFTMAVPLAIAAGTRLSLRAITATCSVGDLTWTGLN